MHEGGRGGEADGEAPLAGGQAEAEGDVGCGSAWNVWTPILGQVCSPIDIRPQRDHHAATVADFCTAISTCSRSTPMICSLANLLRFISGPSPVDRIPAARGGETRGHVRCSMRSAAAMTFLRIWVEKAESGLLNHDMASAELLTECETRIAAPISARQVNP